jgi:hypothetical protein
LSKVDEVEYLLNGESEIAADVVGSRKTKAGEIQVEWPQAGGKADGMKRIRLCLHIEEVII